MAKSYVHELGDKLSNGSTAANLPKHIKEIAPIMYNDGNNNFNSIQTALNGKAASSHTHDSRYYTESEIDTKLNGKAASDHTHGLTFTTSSGTPDYTLKAGDVISMSAGGTTKKVKIVPDVPETAYLIQKSREGYYPSSTSWASIGSLCDGNATTTCTIKWPSDVIAKNLAFSSSRGTVTFTKKGVYHISVDIPLEITAAAPDTYATTNYVFAYIAVYKTGSSDTAGYTYKRANVNRRLSELNTYFLNLEFDAVVNDDNAIMTGEVEFHGLNISGSDGCEITVHQPTASITRVADV